jgi:parallel beta-helix repeat protein
MSDLSRFARGSAYGVGEVGRQLFVFGRRWRGPSWTSTSINQGTSPLTGGTMNFRLLVALAAISGCLVLGLGQASAGRDPDLGSPVDPSMLLPVQIDSALLALGDPLDESSLDYTSTVGVSDTAVGVAAAPASSTSSSPHTFLVDDDKVQCPNAQYMSIQAAVSASGPNDSVRVCPGTYTEQVNIGSGHDGLKLESVKPLQAVIKWPLLETPPLALVYVNGSDRVRIRGFTITGPWTFGGCMFPRHEGVSIEQSFNDDIVANHITEIRNSDPTLRGCQEGDAVAIGMRNYPCGTSLTPNPGSARVEFNWIDKYQKNGVQDVNPGSFADVDHNLITGQNTSPPDAATNSVVVCSAGARVHHNVLDNNHRTTIESSGIILTGAPSGSMVDHNYVFGNDFGIYADSESGVKISHNDVSNNVSDAITLCGEVPFCSAITNSTVDGNDVDSNDGTGILLNAAASNLVKSNRVEQNGTDGIHADSASSNNQIQNNFMDDNVPYDCADDSAGTGTAGTANFWSGDRGETQNRPGLCTNQPHDDDDD